jgi:hypothetical protein
VITVILKRKENKLRVLWVCGNPCALAELGHRLPVALEVFCANNFWIVGPPLGSHGSLNSLRGQDDRVPSSKR